MRLNGLLATFACLALVLAAPAGARKPGPELLAQVEASMVVTGTIDIEPDGTVSGYALDEPDRIPDYVAGLIGDTVPGWRFEPVQDDGRPVRARGPMSLRLLGTPLGDGGLTVSINGANFGDGGDAAAPRSERMRPPVYPSGAIRANVQGDVYLLLKVGLDGAVQDVSVEQVNLRTVVEGRRAEHYRKQLADAATRASKRWRFAETAAEDAPRAGYWTFRLPVNYSIGGVYEPRYGQWQPYFPGERHPRPEWVGRDDGSAPDALLAGKPHALGTGPRLLTPLSES